MAVAYNHTETLPRPETEAWQRSQPSKQYRSEISAGSPVCTTTRKI
jgi:hypothetical protein